VCGTAALILLDVAATANPTPPVPNCPDNEEGSISSGHDRVALLPPVRRPLGIDPLLDKPRGT